MNHEGHEVHEEDISRYNLSWSLHVAGVLISFVFFVFFVCFVVKGTFLV